MHRARAMDFAPNAFRRVFPALLLLCLANSGCNSCYSGSWNANGTGVAATSLSCPLTKATGAVVVTMSTASASSAVSSSLPLPPASPRDVQHIFVTLFGIEAHPNAMANEDSSGWEELVPELAAYPVQLDLVAANSNSRSLGLPAGASNPATIPAEEYRQLRIRLVPPHPSTDALLPEINGCGHVGWNCVVFTDRSVRPLEFDGALAEFHIAQERDTDNIFRVLPNGFIHISIEFQAASSVLIPSNASVRLVSLFSVVSRAVSPSDSLQ